MSEDSKLCELREQIINALGDNEYNVGVFINTEENYISIVYRGHNVCKIDDSYSYVCRYRVVFENDFYDVSLDLPRLKHCANIVRIAYYIKQRITYYINKKGQKAMMTLSDLRDYVLQALGNLVTAAYEVYTDGVHQNRVKINYKGHWVCSIYRDRDNNDLFDVVFYKPFIYREAGFQPFANSLTIAEIPRAIKNRIDIYNGVNNNEIAADYCKNDVDVTKEIYMMTARGSGKTRYITNLLKELNMNIKNNIKDVIFNDPATIVFWIDGSKTVVKCQKGETFDPEKGLAMAISKKFLGNDYGYYETFAKHVGRYNKKRFNKALEEAKKVTPDEVVYNGKKYILADIFSVKSKEE